MMPLSIPQIAKMLTLIGDVVPFGRRSMYPNPMSEGGRPYDGGYFGGGRVTSIGPDEGSKRFSQATGTPYMSVEDSGTYDPGTYDPSDHARATYRNKDFFQADRRSDYQKYMDALAKQRGDQRE